MNNGQIHEISQMLGELLAGQRSMDAKIDSNHSEAGRQWELLHAESRNIKHAQHNLEQADIGHVYALRRMGEKLEPLEALPAAIAAVDDRVGAVEETAGQVKNLTERLGVIEKMAYRVAGIAAAVSVICSIVGAVLLHFASELAHWLIGKP